MGPSPCDLLRGLVAGTSLLVCADLKANLCAICGSKFTDTKFSILYNDRWIVFFQRHTFSNG